MIIIMGVSGSGKSTLGCALAQNLGWDFIEGDDYHPNHNIEKLGARQPLDDEDRHPWLARLHGLLLSYAAQGFSAVLACSALKADYRNLLSRNLADICFVFLCGDPELIRERLKARVHAFMPSGLLESQFAALEPPEDAVLVPVHLPTDEQIRLVRQALGVQERL